MSNPSTVVDFNDTTAAFLATTNQFGEANSLLIQQKFNKAQADGSSLPIFAATEARSRALAQWGNFVDDIALATQLRFDNGALTLDEKPSHPNPGAARGSI